MSKYYLFEIESIVQTFTVLDTGKEISFGYSSSEEQECFENVNSGDLILGYYNEPIDAVKILFEVKGHLEDAQIELVKKLEVQDGVSLTSEIADDLRQKKLLSIYKEKFDEIYGQMLKKQENEEKAEELMKPMIDELYRRFGNLIYTTDENVTLEESIVAALKEKQMTLTTAESCTGGLLAGRIMNVSGASAAYREGYITYANESKEKILGVKHETLEQFGAVSKETAYEMAVGAAKAAGADAALSVTGIAGPDGGTLEKPVGLVYIGCYVNGTVRVEEFRFTGNRSKNRDYAVVRALTLLREELF